MTPAERDEVDRLGARLDASIAGLSQRMDDRMQRLDDRLVALIEASGKAPEEHDRRLRAVESAQAEQRGSINLLRWSIGVAIAVAGLALAYGS